MLELNEEEYNARKERAKAIRKLAGMNTQSNSNISFATDDEYNKKLEEAKKIRESAGMKSIENEENLENLWGNSNDELVKNEEEKTIKDDIKGIGSNFIRSLANLAINAYENTGRVNSGYMEDRNKMMEETEKRILEKELRDKGHTEQEIQEIVTNTPSNIERIAENSKILNKITEEANKIIQPMENKFQEWENANNQKIQENIENASNPISKKVLEVTPSVAQSSVNLIPGGSLIFTAGITQNYYEEAKEQRGMSDEEASKYAAIMATLESASEFIGAGLTKKVGKELLKGNVKSALTTYGLDIGENFLEEAIMEPLSEVTTTVVAGEEKANWDNIGERTLQAGFDGAIASVLMGGASAGVGSAVKVVNKMNNGESVTQEEIQIAIKDIQNSGKVDIKDIFKREIKNSILKNENKETFYITQFNPDGTIANITTATGKQIDNPNKKVNITPVITKNTTTNKYIVIDGNTGILLDTTGYDTLLSAKAGFNSKMVNLDKIAIKQINNKIDETKNIINNKITEIKSTQQNEVKKTQDLNNEEINYISKNKNALKMENENSKKSEFYNEDSHYKVSDINKTTSIFKNNKTYDKITIPSIYDNIDLKDITIFDKNGKEAGTIYIGYEKGQALVQKVDNEGNVLETITINENKNGKISGKDINNSIRKLTYDNTNEPIKGQTDIEGNIYNEIEQKTEKDIKKNNIDEELHNRIQDAINNKKSKRITNLGIISNETANQIKKITGIDVSQRKQLLLDNDIRHMLNEHSNKIKEAKKHQIAITPKDIELIPNVINNYDEIVEGSLNNGEKTIRYIKNIGKNKIYVVEVVPKEKNNLIIKTMWIKPIRVINSQKTPNLTPKAKPNASKSTSINNSVTQKERTVKQATIVNSKDMQENKNNTNIQDFGEKIGGARKDISEKNTNKKINKEVIHDYTVVKAENGYTVNFKGKILKEGFNTQEEAEKYIKSFKENISSNLAFVQEGTNGDGETVYTIKLRNPRTLRTEYIGKSFNNKQDAESYAIALSIYLKEHGKNLFRPTIEKVERINRNSSNATKATGDDILKNFGFRGGEFGNWVNQKERQQFLNYAQDAFTDLAIALDIEPSSLGQNKAMSIAFGARGKGLTGAVAHFEPYKKVINMTRLKGAGSLAHEYGHSIDNYISRVGGYNENGMATTNSINPKLSDNMKNAIKDVINAMNYNTSTNQEEVDNKNKIYEKNRRSSLQSHLNHFDRLFEDKINTYKYNRKTKQREQTTITTTEKQKQEYKTIKNILMEGELKGEVERKINSSTFKVDVIYPKEIKRLQEMYKEIVGRKIDEDTLYWLDRYGRPTKQITEVKSESAFYKSARELERLTGRKTIYYSKVEEMWARAFESYVYDKLKEKGITNTYLVHSVNNDNYALFNPFPAGEERKNINKAFDNLIQVMKNEGLLKNNKNIKSLNEDGIRYMKKNTKQSKQKNINLKDNLGNVLSKGQQEYFENSKIRDEKGNLLVVYHSTPSEFTVFDDTKIGDNTFYGNTAFGHFVTTNKSFSERFKNINNTDVEGKTMELYANVIKPITHPYHAELKYGRKKAIDIVETYLQAINEKEGLNYLRELVEEGEAEDLYDAYMNLSIDGEIYDYAAEERKILEKKGYDAVEIVEGFASELIENSNNKEPIVSYAIFKSKQLKEIDNKNPTNDPDIRKSKKTENVEEGLTNAEREDSYIEQEIKKIEKTGKWDDSIPVTSRTDIRKTIEDYLGLGIKRGKFRQRAYALYKGNRDVMRTKEYKDIDSILHETGHALDLGKRLKIDKERISDELLAAINHLGGYENESRTIQLDEGFAEIIREYATRPEEAKTVYPQTVAVLEELRKKDIEFDKFITKLQKQIYNYIHQNPQNRVLSNMSIGEQTDKRPLSKAWIKQEIMRNVYDKDYALKSAINELAKAGGKTVNEIRASQNAYYLTRLASGIDSKTTYMLSEGYIDENGKQLMPGLKRIGEILGDNVNRYNDLRTFLIAQRDLEYKEKSLKTGLRTLDSKAVVNKFKNDTQIQRASKIIYQTLDGVMQYAVDNKLIDEVEANALRKSNTFYVPMQRVIENNTNNIGRRGAVADIIKKRTGSELDVKDVLENIIVNSSNIIQQVENNKILKALYIEGEKSRLTGAIYDVIPAPMIKVGTAKLQLWEKELREQGVDTSQIDFEKTIDLFAPNNKIDTRNLITNFINDQGQRIYLQFNDELLFNSIMNLDKEMMSQVLKINSKLNMPLRYGATMANVGFAIPNMISDTAQAAIYSNAGFIPVIDNAIGIIDVLSATNNTAKKFIDKVMPGYSERINKLYTIYQQSGASSATRLSQYRKSTQEIMKEIYGTKNSEVLGIKESLKPLKRLLDIITYIPELSEQSTRFRVFERNYEAYKNKGNSEIDARILAALESRDATQDFGRTGNITREINQLIPFSAARVGSAYTFAEKVSANPRQIGMRIAILSVIAMAIKAIGYDDKEIEELNQRKKDDNFVFKVGEQIITIKKPQGILRSIINLTEYIEDLFTGHIEEGKEGERLGEWINNAIMDNMPADSITGLVPNAVAPLIENAINKDFYYNTDIVKSYDLDLPNSEQYYDYNSQLAIILGKIFNYSPAKIDNLINGYFGSLGTSVTNVFDWLSGKIGLSAEEPNMGAEDNAIGKRFVVNVNEYSASIDEIYDRKTELTKKKNGGTITEKEEKELKTITEAISSMSDLNKQIREIKKNLTMSADEKAKEIRKLQNQRTDTARQALGKDLIYEENTEKIENTKFYPNNTLSKNNYTLALTTDMKKEYEQIASDYYNKYAKTGLYSEEKLKEIKSKAKEHAKNELMQKYKSKLVKKRSN